MEILLRQSDVQPTNSFCTRRKAILCSVLHSDIRRLAPLRNAHGRLSIPSTLSSLHSGDVQNGTDARFVSTYPQAGRVNLLTAHRDFDAHLRLTVSASMSNAAQNVSQSELSSLRTPGRASHRWRPLRVLFVHRDAEVVDNCLEELKKAQFSVTADFVLNLGQCGDRLRSQSYDVVVAEYPCPSLKGPQALQVLHKELQETPLLFVANAPRSESVAQLAADGAFDYVERDHVAQLPMAVRQALNEKKLREELEEARKALRHSQSLYRALV